jgi:hypothetical protein
MKDADLTRSGRRNERGFALVLAILSLMLLTFLGLTLATTTSTELQIATNYRWAQQALYNAEAGLDAARIVLSRPPVFDPVQQWLNILPQTRPGPWPPGAAPGPIDAPVGRDFENQACDFRAGMGYGRVLFEGATRYENASVFDGLTLNGAFTVWVRRAIDIRNDGQYSDSARDDVLTIVAEGVAPYVGASTAFTRARQAVRVLETRFNLATTTAGQPCRGVGGQEGLSAQGDNFNPCAPLSAAGSTQALTPVFGGPDAGALTATGAQ